MKTEENKLSETLVEDSESVMQNMVVFFHWGKIKREASASVRARKVLVIAVTVQLILTDY